MKKFVLIVFVLSCFFSLEVFSQADVKNDTDYSLAIDQGRYSLILPSGSIKRVPFFPGNGEVNFQIFWTQSGRRQSQVVNDIIKDNYYVIKDSHLRGEKTEIVKQEQKYVREPEVIRSDYKTRLTITNESSQTLWIREGTLAGLVLSPDQQSDTITMPLGMIELTLLVDLDDSQSSTGRNYMQKVVTGLIAKDKQNFAITDTHLNIPVLSGNTTFLFNNQTGHDVVGVGSIALGKVIEANSTYRQRRIKANEGFINTAWQYFDNNGVKRQAISEFVVVDGRVRVDIKPSHLRRRFVR